MIVDGESEEFVAPIGYGRLSGNGVAEQSGEIRGAIRTRRGGFPISSRWGCTPQVFCKHIKKRHLGDVRFVCI
jgi:hypothetical protein